MIRIIMHSRAYGNTFTLKKEMLGLIIGALKSSAECRSPNQTKLITSY